MLVVDASVILPACGSPDGFSIFQNQELVAPPLLWSECRSVLHEALFRREISQAAAQRTFETLERAPVKNRSHRRLGRRSWQLADEFGWAKTYDAEYLALAQLLSVRLVTIDARLRRATARLGFVISPLEL